MIKNLYGEEIAKTIKSELQIQCSALKPKLAIISSGDDFAGNQYIRQIEKSAKTLGVEVQLLSIPLAVTEEELIENIKELNSDEEIDGIIVQVPLPAGINTQRVIESLDVKKDIDGLHPYNLGRLFSGLPTLVPCTAKAVMRLLEHYNYDVTGKNVIVVGRSLAVGKPLSALLTKADATVVLCHSKTAELFKITQKADIIITAIGKPSFFDETFFSSDSIVIDVGINAKENGVCGDVDYQKVAAKVQAITPVPKGVGSLTIAMLLENLVEVSRKRRRNNGL